MKKLLVLLVVAFRIFCFGSDAMAESTVYGDYGSSVASGFFDYWADGISYFTIGAEYDMDPFVFGGVYSFDLGTDPEYPEPYSGASSVFAAYGGYNLLGGDTFSLAALGGYMSLAIGAKEEGYGFVEAEKFTGFAVGLKGRLSMEPLSITGLYLCGISPEYEYTEYNYTYTYDKDIIMSLFELRGTYRFSDSLGVYLGYRSIGGGFKDDDGKLKGFVAGAEYRF
ncbi:MAG: hypothetical protein GX493_09255 [Firmicutes bacterium]|nr:hypothetical protein [Bacillota bacterium]